MANVTYNSVTIPYGHVTVDPHDVEFKTWAFPQVDGTNFMALGFRGRPISVSGMSVAGGISKATLNGFVDDDVHTLVDGASTSYPNCLCTGVSFGPNFRTQDGMCFRFDIALLQMEE